MTEWDAANYIRRSSLQETMAAEVLALLRVSGNERVLDIGCGDGRITAKIASRLPQGSVLGVDSSHDMILFALHHNAPNLNFQVADASNLSFRNEFDLIVSFNALHWLPDPNPPLKCIRAAMKSNAQAQLRLVPDGERKSLETVLEETRLSPRWSRYYDNFRNPYLHLTPDQYAQVAERNGFGVQRLRTTSHSWDFQSRENFFAFGQVTFIEWTRCLPDPEKPAFINDVLDRYAAVTANFALSNDLAAGLPGRNSDEHTNNSTAPHTFHFYQMDITLTPA
jgi:trans-aconitate 2-methyltransferase